MKSSLHERLKIFIDYLGISHNKFARSIGISGAQISYIINSHQNFGVDKLLKIINIYPELNVEWLLTGKDKMLKKTGEAPSDEELTDKVYDPQVAYDRLSRSVKIYFAHMHYVQDFIRSRNKKEFVKNLPYFSVPGIAKEAVCFEIDNDTMYPTLSPNDLVICLLEDQKQSIRDSFIYTTIYDNQLFFSRLVNHKETGEIEFVFDSRSANSFKILKDRIVNCYTVVGVLTKNLTPRNLVEQEIYKFKEDLMKNIIKDLLKKE